MGIRDRIKKINDECSGVWGQSGVSQWERDRLVEWANKTSLSEKQEEILAGIEKKVFGDAED